MRRLTILLIALCLILSVGPTASLAQRPAAPDPQFSPETRKAVEQSLEKGLAFLRTQQKPNGSWEFHEGMTGLVLLAFYKSAARSPKDDAMLERGLMFLTTLAKPDGSIFSRDMPNANTA